MRYFRKTPTEVYGYDETQGDLSDLALQNGWEEITGSWPPPPEPTPPQTQITPLQFLDRFNSSEQIAVITATMQMPAIKFWYDRMIAATFVDLADPRVEMGLSVMVSYGMLTEDRKAEILTP